MSPHVLRTPTIAAGIALALFLQAGKVATPPNETFQGQLMGGEAYMTDVARFTDCRSGQDYPIATEGDFARLQKTYGDRVSSPGARLYVTFEGTLAERQRTGGSGTVKTVVVSTFVDAWPNQNCERSKAHALLDNNYWRITQLAGKPVTPPSGGLREPHVIFRNADGNQSYSATVGCNSMSGSYAVSGGQVTFTTGASTLMACQPPLDTMERELRTAIMGTRQWQIFGNTLELRDETGARLALFEATPMK